MSKEKEMDEEREVLNKLYMELSKKTLEYLTNQDESSPFVVNRNIYMISLVDKLYNSLNNPSIEKGRTLMSKYSTPGRIGGGDS